LNEFVRWQYLKKLHAKKLAGLMILQVRGAFKKSPGSTFILQLWNIFIFIFKLRNNVNTQKVNAFAFAVVQLVQLVQGYQPMLQQLGVLLEIIENMSPFGSAAVAVAAVWLQKKAVYCLLGPIYFLHWKRRICKARITCFFCTVHVIALFNEQYN